MSFFLELAAKDVRLACEMGRENKVPMDMANIIEQKVIEAMNKGWGKKNSGIVRKISGKEKNTTNNRMELMAPINALKEMDPKSEIEIFTDSQYVKLGITEWINTWIKNNWKTSKKEDVKNKDLWLELYNLDQSLKIKWNWVKAHAGNPLN